jgi:hypothetical protein
MTSRINIAKIIIAGNRTNSTRKNIVDSINREAISLPPYLPAEDIL